MHTCSTPMQKDTTRTTGILQSVFLLNLFTFYRHLSLFLYVIIRIINSHFLISIISFCVCSSLPWNIHHGWFQHASFLLVNHLNLRAHRLVKHPHPHFYCIQFIKYAHAFFFPPLYVLVSMYVLMWCSHEFVVCRCVCVLPPAAGMCWQCVEQQGVESEIPILIN